MNWRNPNYEFDRSPSLHQVLFGDDHFVQKCGHGGHVEFKFYSDGFFPMVFEAYEKLNVSLAEMLDTVGNETVVEIDAANGVLPNLVENPRVDRFFHMVMHPKSRSLLSNLSKLNDTKCRSKVLNGISKCTRNFKYVLDDCHENTRMSIVFQNFFQPMFSYEKKQSQ